MLGQIIRMSLMSRLCIHWRLNHNYRIILKRKKECVFGIAQNNFLNYDNSLLSEKLQSYREQVVHLVTMYFPTSLQKIRCFH